MLYTRCTLPYTAVHCVLRRPYTAVHRRTPSVVHLRTDLLYTVRGTLSLPYRPAVHRRTPSVQGPVRYRWTTDGVHLPYSLVIIDTLLVCRSVSGWCSLAGLGSPKGITQSNASEQPLRHDLRRPPWTVPRLAGMPAELHHLANLAQ